MRGDDNAASHVMSQHTKWKTVATAISLPVLAVLVLFSISLVKPWSVRIGKANFGARTKEGLTLAPGRIMDGEITRFPNQNLYNWYVKTGKRKLLVFTFTWI